MRTNQTKLLNLAFLLALVAIRLLLKHGSDLGVKNFDYKSIARHCPFVIRYHRFAT
jgi:hypothetical protein